MKHCRFLIWILLLVTAWPLAALGAAGRPDDLELPELKFAIEYPETFQLSNGIQVYYRQDAELPLVDVTMVVESGKITAPPQKAGLAELVADNLKKGGAGTWDAAAFDTALDALAASLKVTAGTYTTRSSLSLLKEDVRPGLALLAAMLRQPHFDAERFEISRNQMLEGIRRKADHGAALARQILMSRLYAGHPLAESPTLHSVAAISREDLQANHQRYFGPSNTRIVFTGDVGKDTAKALLEEAFGDWHHDSVTPDVPPLQPQVQAGVVLVDRPVPQTTILLGELAIEKNNPDLYAVQVMNYILGGGGFSSRLMREIRSNRGLAYSVYSYFSVGRRLPGVFISAAETKNASVGEVVGLMHKEMERIGREAISVAELEQAKQSLINSFVFAFDNRHALATRILDQELFGYPEDYLDRYRQRIAAVTIDDVQRVARRYLHPEQQVTVLIGDIEVLRDTVKSWNVPVTERRVEDLL
ncbi:insulinase family protein [Desulfuromonas acetoxidans]|uniref:Peptidase M16-like n=1 Tax=Desulfuromonas acetoxidans (strain DSM 684 / 11070) TaxID=281689 RepID=Q1K0W9_DESA6|nr:pitrilysin family protein [Desulfuromonas acetoxidans]EAT16239.1 peptidase M16-like [Desulfuromonas acetoxidans DSM 684]MBF0645187.1 insulinase family protein [Desulfuromonas acetoxidans]NVD23069.1 insulinase family protein [Desulfuromonas acetoxidans]NVE15690.1 insulinase family protein [Desulfuromonas acetoxidans]